MAGIEVSGVYIDFMVYARSFINRFIDDVALLVHELVHVTQYYATGSQLSFACAYGIGYREGGSYRENPLEDQAYQFVDAHYAEIESWDLRSDP